MYEPILILGLFMARVSEINMLNRVQFIQGWQIKLVTA